MKVSRNWLQNYFDDALPDADALAEALTFHAFEIESVEGDVLDVKVTPNRGQDCLSHRGIAKEISALIALPLQNAHFKLLFDLGGRTDEINVKIEDPKTCQRYIAGYIKGIKVGSSPEWLKQSLEQIGQRSINNIVDATNLVMFNTGQPLHAFDAAHVRGTIRVRLDDGVLVIADDHGILGYAGIKGGEASRITERTTNIIIESATFDGPTIRRGSKQLKLRTEASARFEQVISPELAAHGMRQAVKLILELAGGEC